MECLSQQRQPILGRPAQRLAISSLGEYEAFERHRVGSESYAVYFTFTSALEQVRLWRPCTPAAWTHIILIVLRLSLRWSFCRDRGSEAPPYV